jgi:hypothetical protein
MSGAGITRSRTIQLRNEYKKALEEDKTAGEIILNGLTRCATEECLQLTDLMYRKLPTELRNLVYRFLCIEDQAIPVGPYYHFRPYDPTRKGSSNNRLAIGLSSGRILDDHSERPDPAILMPDSHIFNMAYMGQKVAFETQKAYLANNTFSVCNVENGIYHFLNSIEYGVSVTSNTFSRERPRAFIVPYGYVRKLQIRVKYEHCKPFLPDYLPAASGGYRGMFADECYFLRHSKNALGVLQHLPQRAQPLELEFIIMTETDQLTEVDGRESKGDLSFINLLQALRNTFYALMYDRENTKIRIIHHDEHISPFPRDITLLWSLTKEQWEYVRNLVPFLTFARTRARRASRPPNRVDISSHQTNSATGKGGE